MSDLNSRLRARAQKKLERDLDVAARQLVNLSPSNLYLPLYEKAGKEGADYKHVDVYRAIHYIKGAITEARATDYENNEITEFLNSVEDLKAQIADVEADINFEY